MSIIVSIISQFNGKGFDKAQKQTGILAKGMKKLGLAVGAALSAQKIVQFANKSVKAFLEEDRAVRTLGKTLQNLSLAYNTQGVERFIAETQAATGVLDDELRPAFSQFATVTRNLTKSQELLNLSLDISAATGKSLSSVTAALTRAYAGNTTSLSRLNIGLSKTDLTTKSIDEIVTSLTKQFRGSAATAASTYEGRVKKLNVALDEAQETIGQGLVKGLDALSGEGKGIEELAKFTGEWAQQISDAAYGIGILGAELNKMTDGGLSKFLKALLQPPPWWQFVIQRGKQKRLVDEYNQSQNRVAGRLRRQQRLDLEGEKTKTKELTKQQKLKLETAKLDKARSMLDLEKIQIEAALQGELTENERLRLQLMKAVLNENADRAATLADKLAKSQTELAALKSASYDFKPSNPFDAWLDSIEAMRKGLASIGAPVGTIPGAATPSGGMSALSVTPNMPEVSVFGGAGFITPQLATQNPTGMAVNIKVEGSVYVDDFERRVVDAVVAASSGGGATNWYRTTGRATL